MMQVMLDLETMGTCPQAVICCVAAVEFDPETGELGREFYQRVRWNGYQSDRWLDRGTLEWWDKQGEEAKWEVFGPAAVRVSLNMALNGLQLWLGEDPVVWGNGATFDVSILEDAYGHAPPWKFRDVRDVRTVVALAEGIVEKPRMAEGMAHHALEDAKHQARYVSEMWQALRGGAGRGGVRTGEDAPVGVLELEQEVERLGRERDRAILERDVARNSLAGVMATAGAVVGGQG